MGTVSAENNFLFLKKVYYQEAQLIVVPFGFEKTTTYGKGTAVGPKAIIQASQNIEYFDEEVNFDFRQKANIATLKNLTVGKSVDKARVRIGKIIKQILVDRKLPIILGGEHSVTPFVLEEFYRQGRTFSILQFDAHADLRDGYLGQKYSHAAAMRRCLDLAGINLVQIGVRNISNENDELNYWKNNQDRIKTFWAQDKNNWYIDEILGALKDNVYLTFDVDALDPAIMPSTGTPEPGGLQWYETLDILRAVAKNKKIIGADFVELSPIKNLSAPDFLVAKLIFKLMVYLQK